MSVEAEGLVPYALRMNQHQVHPDIYQLRIVLRGISPLIWRRLLVRSDTTLAQFHRMLQILLAWSNEHLHHFHIYGKDYGSNEANTRHVTLRSFGLRQGERFQYIYNIMHTGSVTFAWRQRYPGSRSGLILSVPGASDRPHPSMSRTPRPIWNYSTRTGIPPWTRSGCWPMPRRCC